MKSDFQLGKNGITENFTQNLKALFLTRRMVRISILANGPRDEKKKVAEKLVETLGKNYSSKVIGFVIVLTKWRTPRS